MRQGDFDVGFAAFSQSFIVLAVSPVSPEPCECALHHPPSRQQLKADGLGPAADDFKQPAARGFGPGFQSSRIPTVGPDQLQTRTTIFQLLQHELGAVAILNAGRMHHHGQHKSERIHDYVPLATRDLLARVIAPRPPFSAVFTDWLSMIAAEGSSFRPESNRTLRCRVS